MKNKLGLLLLLLCVATSAMAKVYDYTDGNKLTLIEDPALGVDHKVELIRSAKHHIHILTFFWDKSKVPARLAKELHDANARGVEVRILTTMIPTLSTDLLGRGKRKLHAGSDAVFAYEALTPGTSFSFTNSLHEKIFLVDGEKAIIGGRNISDSSLNGKDMEVEMQGPVVNQVQDHFKKMFDFVISLKKKACNPETAPNCEADYDHLTFGNSSKYFPTQPQYEDGAPARILSHEAVIHQYENGIKRSERLDQPDDILDTVTKIEFKKMRAYNYFMLPTKRYRNFLDKNLAAGNSIEIITNSLESAKFSSNWGYIYSIPDALELVNQGLELYQWQRKQKLNYVHEKVLIFDEDHVIIGSHNFGTGSTGVSNEISIEIKSKAIADRLIEVFDFEKTNTAITHKVDSELLEKEYDSHKSMISLLRKKLLSSILLEIY